MNDNSSQPEELERRIDRELRRQPLIRAPRTLAPRVLQAIARRQLIPWWRQSWNHWPVNFRFLFLIAGCSVLGLALFGAMSLPQWIQLQPSVPAAMADRFENVRSLFDAIGKTAGALVLAFKSANPALLWTLCAMLVLGYSVCVGLATLGYRLAFHRQLTK